MFTRPTDVDDRDVAAVFSANWAESLDTIEYAPVGFGSHHWLATAQDRRWFLTADAVGTDSNDASPARSEKLEAALQTAHHLHTTSCDFVVAPRLTIDGKVTAPLADRYRLAVYPYIEGSAGEWGRFANHDERTAVVHRLVDLHANETARHLALPDDLAVPCRTELGDALRTLDTCWDAGPFSEEARLLLRQHEQPLREAFARYDELVRYVEATRSTFVVTHGEPHRGNIIFTADAGAKLIDWDTTLLAPPERDLWSLIVEDSAIAEVYPSLSGRVLQQDALDLYRLGWDLAEVSLYINDFRTTHIESEDTRTAWAGLQEHLDPARWSAFL